MFLHDYNRIILLVGIITACLVFVAILLKGIKLLLRFRQKRMKRRSMLEMIESARTEGNPFYIQMYGQDEIMGDMQWNCESVSPQGITLSLNSHDSNLFETDQSVTAYFKVFYKGQDRYYSFQCKVLALARGSGGTTLLLSLPQELGTSQKRRFLRIRPIQGSVLNLTVWHHVLALSQDSLDASSGKPHPRSKDLLLDENSEPGSGPEWVAMPYQRVTMEDISEGGICLRVQGKRNALVPQERLIIHAELGGPFNAGAADLYFFCEVLRFSMVTPRAGEIGPVFRLGIKFLRWAQRRSDGYAWKPVSERANVAPLVAWIRRQHHYQHRLVDD